MWHERSNQTEPTVLQLMIVRFLNTEASGRTF